MQIAITLALVCLVLAGNLAHAAKEYTVWVGFEKVAFGMQIQKMTPEVLQVHRGDIITFKQKSHDPHTVTFHPGTPLPELNLPDGSVNPVAGVVTDLTGKQYNGTYYVNSGIMVKGSPNTQYQLSFSALGEFKYACIVHGPSMNGSIVVVDDNVKIPSPKQISMKLAQWAAKIEAGLPKAYAKGLKGIPKPVKNPDGNHTHFVRIGFLQPPYEFMQYFPRVLEVGPGDVVEWSGATFHTVTFPNGQPMPDILVFDPTVMKVVLNKKALIPANTTVPLTHANFVNSGLIVDPTIKFRLTIGNVKGTLDYGCIPHFPSGMKAKLVVSKKH